MRYGLYRSPDYAWIIFLAHKKKVHFLWVAFNRELV